MKRTIRILSSLVLGAFIVVPATAVADASDIKTSLNQQITSDHHLQDDEIMIDVSNGVVQLEGVVDTIYEKRRAADWASHTKGVLSVVNQITVEDTDRKDSTISKGIKEELSMHPVTETWDINIRVNDGMAVLTGLTQSRVERNFAEDLAARVPGVTSIDNQINVKHYNIERTDEEVKKDIKNRLENNIVVDERHLVINVEDGVVTFTGPVVSLADKHRIEELAWINGVQNVIMDDVTVDADEFSGEDTTTRDDLVYRDNDTIRDALYTALEFDPRVNDDALMIHVRDGVVTLTGIVHSLNAKEAVENNAKNTKGVLHVENYLVVRSNPYESDRMLENRLNNALERNIYVPEEKIDVSVDGQIVKLTGTVEDLFAKGQAEFAAEQIPGVQDVNNDITVFNVTTAYTESMKESIEMQLSSNPFIDSSDIAVVVKNDVVTLWGNVDSLHEKRYVELASYNSGADNVRNYLDVDKPMR